MQKIKEIFTHFFNIKKLKEFFQDFRKKTGKIIKYGLIILSLIGIFFSLFFYLFFYDPDFYIEKLPKNIQNQLILSEKWNEKCTSVSISRLRFINVKFYEKKNTINKNGNLILLDSVAKDALNIFKTFYKKKIIIEKIKTTNYYDNFESSYLDNNSISFVCDSNLQNLYPVLNYQYGTAIDLNPLYNPKIEFIIIPEQKDNKIFFMKSNLDSIDFVNRKKQNLRMNENFTKIFAQNGFTEWGGDFNVSDKIIAFNYFGVNKIVNDLLIFMDPEDARIFFQIIKRNYKIVNKIDQREFFIEFRNFYKKDKKKFFFLIRKYLSKLKNMESGDFLNFLKEKFNSN